MLELTHKYIAFDQYGQPIWIKAHPRKELMETCDLRHASKMYIDTKDKVTHHVGYVVGCRWFNVYQITPAFKEPSK